MSHTKCAKYLQLQPNGRRGRVGADTCHRRGLICRQQRSCSFVTPKSRTAMSRGVTAAGNADAKELTVRGWQRSGALVRLFAPRDGQFVDPRLAQPKAIFASAVGKHSNSLRPQHTVLALAKELKLLLDLRFPKGDEPGLAVAARSRRRTCSHRLGAREHSSHRQRHRRERNHMPAKVVRLLRFDLVWVLDRRTTATGWDFAQLPQMLLPGDGE